jgi:ABC-type nitrate/sulfonate/bicarbonate transport system substrate-binding protein
LLVFAALNKSKKTSAAFKTVQIVARIATDAPDQRAEGAMVGSPARDRLVAVLALVFATVGLTPAASATLTVGKAAPNADPIIPVDVGEQLGIFKKHGLDLKIVDFTGGSKMTQAMAAGALDIGDGAGTEMALVAKGAPMIAICETAGPIPFIGIGVPWDSPIKTIDQLKGKKIGYSSAGSLTDWLTRELARKQGWAPQDVTGVAIGNGASSIIAAFREHLIDADVAVTSLFLAMEENKTGRLLFPVSKYEGKLAAGTLYASNHVIETNPDAVRAFVAAWIETVDYIRTHKAETVKIESAITGFPESVMAKDYDLTVGMFTKDCKFDAESLETLKNSFVELNLLPSAPDMSKLYTEKFLPQ